MDEAVRCARKVFRSKEWAQFGVVNRSKCLNKLADLMEEHFEEILAIEMIDTGKTRTQAANLDLPGSIGTIRYFAGWCDKIYGQSNFGINNVFGYTKREAVGVCGQIIPWKYVSTAFSKQPWRLTNLAVFHFSCSRGRLRQRSPQAIQSLSNLPKLHH